MGRKNRKSGNQQLSQTTAKRWSAPVIFLTCAAIALAAAFAYYFPGADKHRDAGRDSGPSAGKNPPAHSLADFVGANACARCHQKQFDLWQASTHGRAGGTPNQAKIIARFDGTPLQFRDAVVTPTITPKGEYVFQIEPEGAPKKEIKVHAVVGGGHMQGGGTQSFFEKFADGTVRFLPFDFIRRENHWFVQLRRDKRWVPITREISLQSDLANWPPNRVLGTLTEFSNCQNCHGSQIAVQYDKESRKYKTEYSTLQINCESCHGPGKRHMEIVSKAGFERLQDIGMEALATASKERSLTVCFQCHATKDIINEEPYLPGAPFNDYFSVKLPVFQETFTVDGRVKSFGYQSTHLFSDCYLNGSMTCVDCHDPHSQGYRDVFGKALAGRFDNGQCTSCHASKKLATEQHTHHKSDSAGTLCASCHMPYLQHQGIGPHLGYARSDHSIPVPRPAFDQQLGIENACQKCHRDKDLSWQETHIKEWYGTIKPHNPAIANLIAAASAQDSAEAAKLLLDPAANHPMAQMSGLAAYTRRFLRPNMPAADADVLRRLKAFAQSPDLDLKSLGLLALHLAFDTEQEVRTLLDQQLSDLKTDKAVRNRWGIAADYFGNSYADAGDFSNAILCFKKSLDVMPDNVVTMSHLALAYLKAGDVESGLTWLKKGVKQKPEKAVLHFQLAQTYAQLQQIPQAIQELEEGLKYSPEDPTARRMLRQLRGL